MRSVEPEVAAYRVVLQGWHCAAGLVDGLALL
jgi:hypothetical protein